MLYQINDDILGIRYVKVVGDTESISKSESFIYVQTLNNIAVQGSITCCQPLGHEAMGRNCTRNST